MSSRDHSVDSNESTTSSMMEEENIKILVIGEAACGKTSLVNKYCLNKFEPKYKITMGIDFFSKEIEVDGRKLQINLWDVSGQERFHHMVRSYFQNASAAIIVFDSQRILPTLNAAGLWKDEVDNCFPDPIPTILLANKCDLLKERDGLNKILNPFIEEHQIDHWAFSSAKTGEGVNEALDYLVKRVLESNILLNKQNPEKEGSFKLTGDNAQQNRNGQNNSSNNTDTEKKSCCSS